MKGNKPEATHRTALSLIFIALLSFVILMTPADVAQKVKSLIQNRIRAN